MNNAHIAKKKSKTKQGFGNSEFSLPWDKLTPQALNDLRRYCKPGDVLEFVIQDDFTLGFQVKRGDKTVKLPISFFPGLKPEVHAWVGGLVQPVDEPVDYSEKHANTRKAINRKHRLLTAQASGVRFNLLMTEVKPQIVSRDLTRYWEFDLGTYKAYTSVGNKDELWFIISNDEPDVEQYLPKEEEELTTTRLK